MPSSLSRTLWLALLAAGAILVGDAVVPGEAHALCVRGVASDDVLNMRSGPGTGNRIVGAIPPGVCGVRLLDRSGRWRRVRYGGGTGWVNGRFLEADGDDSVGRGDDYYSACVVGVARNDVLNVRSRATSSARIVTVIPPGSCGVRVYSGGGPWSRVQWGAVAGFAASRYLTRP